jgi:hypothetical protein
MELSMSEANHTSNVSRAEFYSTASLAFLLPAVLFVASGSFPDSLLRQIAVALMFLTMVGLSVTFSIMAILERRRQKKVGS